MSKHKEKTNSGLALAGLHQHVWHVVGCCDVIGVERMALYRAAAAKIFHRKRIVCGLLWTDGPTLMQLSNRLLDAELGRIRARLDPEGARS